MHVSVWVDSWQQQCCGVGFGVGDRVSWRLTIAGAQLTADLADATLTAVGLLPVPGDLPTESVAGPGTTLGVGSLRAFVRAGWEPVPDDGVPCPVGLFAEDHHIDVPHDLPVSVGTVRRVRLVRFPYRFDDTRQGWIPQPGGARLVEVAAAEQWPAEVVGDARFRGFLVDLEVDQ